MATPDKMHIQLTRPYGDHKEGDVLEMFPAAAKRFVNTGFAKPVSAKAVSEPPRNKSMQGRNTPNKAGHEDHAGQAAATA